MRNAVDLEIYKKLKKVFINNKKSKRELVYQGNFEKEYCKNFSKFISKNKYKGYSDAVNSGTSALFIAASIFFKNKKDEVLFSPVTNIGTLSAVIFAGYRKIKLCDSERDSFQISLESIKKKINKNTRLIIVTHIGGFASNIDKIKNLKKKFPNLKIIEDCSQAHGTIFKGKTLGIFGDIACFSTMFRKNLVTGGIGGILFTLKKEYYQKIRSFADRGKQFHKKNFDPKNYNFYQEPALNLNLDEISCFIGNENLKKLHKINADRYRIYNYIRNKMKSNNLFEVYSNKNLNFVSVYFVTIRIKSQKKNKILQIKKLLKNCKLPLNLNYQECVYTWKNFSKYIQYSKNDYININNFKEETFNILFHEKTKTSEINKICEKLIEISKKF